MPARIVTVATTASDAARSLWSRAGGDSWEAAEVAEAVEYVRRVLGSGLGRWIGAEGYRALLDRARKQIREEHPALDGLAVLGEAEPVSAAAVAAQGTEAVAAGMVALLATMTGVLGRIIGEEMAVRLVEQIGTPSPRGAVSSDLSGGRNG